MTTLYQPFEAVTSDFSNPTMKVDKCISPIYGPMMRLRYSRDEIVCITKTQAMTFFGLVDAPVITDPQGDNKLY